MSIKPKNLHDMIPVRIEEWGLEKQASKTGYPELDGLIKGFVPKHLYTLTGKTNAGKTTFACNLAYRVAKQNKSVLYIALEPDTAIVDILASIATKKKYSDLTEEDLQLIPKNIDVFGSEIQTFAQLQLTLRSGMHYDLVIVDHAGYFIREANSSNFTQQQSQFVQSVARLAKETGNSILLIAHLSKEGSRKDQPTIYDISGSASYSQDSTEVLIFNRKADSFDEFKQSDQAVLIVGKTKSGRTGSIKFNFLEGSGYIKSEFENNLEDYEITKMFS